MAQLFRDSLDLQETFGVTHLYLFSPIPYTFLHQRPQKLADKFSAMGIRVTYIEPCGFKEFLAGNKKGISRLIFASVFYHILALIAFVLPFRNRKPHHPGVQTSVATGIESLSLPLVIPYNRFNSRMLERLNACVYRQVLIRKVFRRMQPGEVSFALVQNPFFGIVIRENDFSRVFYDSLDEIRLFSGRASANRFQDYERQIVSLSSAVFVTAKKLEDHIRSLQSAPRIHRVPNGVDPEWFQERASTSSVPDDIRTVRRPVVGYTGLLSSWLDYDLIGVLATTFPDVSFVFVGPIDFDFRIDSLRSHPNLHWLGRKPYSDIPVYIHAFDVCMIPFKYGEISQATNPVKIFEYFALGKPVVSTLIDELIPFQKDGLVWMGDTVESFVAGLRSALVENDPHRKASRTRVATEHSWQAHARTMMSVMNDVPT